MAITGTGTSESPYIVSTWEEFLSVATDTSAYIKCADNCVWDFNEIAPEGIQNIDISFAEWDGNGVELRNITFVNPNSSVRMFGIKFGGTLNATLKTIKNVNFLNFYVNQENTQADYSTVFLYFGNYFQVKNCKFSGLVHKGFLLSSQRGISDADNCSIFSNCSFNIKFYNNGSFYVLGNGSYQKYPVMNNCKFNFDGNGNTDSTLCNSYSSVYALKLTNSKIIGKIPFRNMWFVGSTVVIDAETNDNNAMGFMSGTYNQCIINSDKYTNPTTPPSSIHMFTSAQMIDVETLQSIGFPIVEV